MTDLADKERARLKEWLGKNKGRLDDPPSCPHGVMAGICPRCVAEGKLELGKRTAEVMPGHDADKLPEEKMPDRFERIGAYVARLEADPETAEHVRKARAALFAAKLAKFVRWVIEAGPLEGAALHCDMIKTRALAAGIMANEPYDPFVHGEIYAMNAGDDVFVFSQAFRDLEKS